MVVNEYGEVEGLVTLEDVIEEIVGEIRDEYDAEERGPVERLPDGSLVVSGSALLRDLQSDYELPFEETVDYHTLAARRKLQRRTGWPLCDGGRTEAVKIPRGGVRAGETEAHPTAAEKIDH